MDDLIDFICEIFGLPADPRPTLTRGPRGALGQIWRMEAGGKRYAVKELFAGASSYVTSEAIVRVEVEFATRALTFGVRAPASYPAVDGRYVAPIVSRPGWLRLYDWVEGKEVDESDKELPGRLGTLLGRLHACAPMCNLEPDGSAPDPWFEYPPPPDAWTPLAAEAIAQNASWAAEFGRRARELPILSALASPADQSIMATCHRDLHPENVLVDTDGELVVVDWDNLGPADRSRELARVLLDWFYENGTANADAIRALLSTYHQTGAPGRLRDVSVFGLVIASRLNFLIKQVRIALDRQAEPQHREWAVREIEEALSILPTPATFEHVLAIGRTVGQG